LPYKTPFPVAFLGPGVGIKQVYAVKLIVRQPIEYLGCIVIIESDIGQIVVLNLTKHFHHAVDERFHPDKPDMGMGDCLRDQMLPTPKTYFHANLRRLAGE